MLPKKQNDRTRNLNPKLGWLGILGFVGLLGIWSYQESNDVFPFIFFGFFGFFGFFFEGIMSNTLKDERYIENRMRAQLKAYRIGFFITVMTLYASSWGWLFRTNDSKLLFITIALSLTYALVIFLAEYLLYRYDSKDNGEE